ncbi:MAG: hypothetical protein FWF43_05385, partial [Propionibacteriaceae bacterium]|nr:hypothetical protein [Propionibacteriaceae bacterium]
MHTAHAFWWPHRGLAVWGEDADRAVKSTSSALRSARPHTFAASGDDLRVVSDDVTTAVLALPSVRTAPLDSPELMRPVPRPAPREVNLMAWSVPVAVLTGPEALTWLTGSTTRSSPSGRDDPELSDWADTNPPDWDDAVWDDSDWDDADSADWEDWDLLGDHEERQPDPLEEVRLGASVHFFRTLARFATQLGDQGQYLPALAILGDSEPTAGRAYWRAVLRGENARFAAMAATALPPVARALVTSAQDLTGLAPNAVVEEALDALVDAVVRRRLESEEIRLGAPPVKRRGRPPVRRPVAESFLTALSSPQATFTASTKEASGLRDQLAIWDHVGQGRDARLHMRLMEPGSDENEHWNLTFSLQSVADESLVVAADQIWQAGASLDRWMDKPDQTLLTELGRAAGVWPVLS